jgi:L-2,4-diaminobutyric acid acetyltransferase
MPEMQQEAGTSIEIRAPRRSDGAAIHALVEACPPLDLNSCYAYLLLAEHCAGTCVLAENAAGQVLGFVSAYLPPEREDTVFVWQVAVHDQARGQGLALRMLEAVLRRPACRRVRFLETTVSPGNRASRALFAGLAARCDAPLAEQPLFLRGDFGGQAHEDEPLLRIGPLRAESLHFLAGHRLAPPRPAH